MIWRAVIQGQLVSKSNSRRLVNRGRRPMIIKSANALDWIAKGAMQVQRRRQPIEADVAMTAIIYYQSRRSDLDESLLMDGLQAWGIIKNDRQIREKHIYGYVDKVRPRVVVSLQPIDDEWEVPIAD